MDANRVNRNIAFDSDRLHWEHANASFTACSCERHAPPRLRQMKPRVRRGLVGLNVKDNRTSRRMVCRARNSVRCASIIFSPIRLRIVVAIGAVSGLTLQQSPQRCGDVAKKRPRGDKKAVAQTRGDAFGQAADVTVSSAPKSRRTAGIVQPRPVDVVLDDQDVMAVRNRRERMPSLLV